MTFAQALLGLKSGTCVQRPNWPEYQYLTTTPRGGLVVHGQYDQEQMVTLADALASDWILYTGQAMRSDPTPAKPGRRWGR